MLLIPTSLLFILDGFEVDLQTIVDLNMERVASVTILKDAASTAIYGSRAANGVVVVETKRPAREPCVCLIMEISRFRCRISATTI